MLPDKPIHFVKGGQLCDEQYANYKYTKAFEAGKQEGRKEVIERYKKDNPNAYGKYRIYWERLLKEWGLS